MNYGLYHVPYEFSKVSVVSGGTLIDLTGKVSQSVAYVIKYMYCAAASFNNPMWDNFKRHL